MSLKCHAGTSEFRIPHPATRFRPSRRISVFSSHCPSTSFHLVQEPSQTRQGPRPAAETKKKTGSPCLTLRHRSDSITTASPMVGLFQLWWLEALLVDVGNRSAQAPGMGRIHQEQASPDTPPAHLFPGGAVGESPIAISFP